MGWRSATRLGAPPSNPALRSAIQQVLGRANGYPPGRPTGRTRAALERALRAGPLLVAVRELPRSDGSAPIRPGEELPMRFVTCEGPERTPVLAVFTDPKAVAARAPAGVWLSVDPEALLRWIAEEGLDGLVVNPPSPACFVCRNQVLDMLGLQVRRGEGRSLSADPQTEASIREALETLLEEASLGGLVRLREPRTRRELQFAVDFEKGLRMIVPRGQLERDEAQRARLMFDELAGMPSDPADTEAEARDLQALFSGDPGHAARAALKVFTWVFGLPPGFALEIEG